ncbi:hypothetical protein GGF46_005336 [Coemansia sp. RSA 552]|nr:hypothetical protein GGF46_005336 [Coemansia sp. RSA 552]
MAVETRSPTGSDVWDSVTLTPRTPSPVTFGSDCSLALQMKQQKRTIDDLSKQLELREGEIDTYLRQIDELGVEVDSGRRRQHADQQALQRLEELVGWHDEQQQLCREDMVRVELSHRSALQRTERQGAKAVDRLLLKLSGAEEESKLLTVRISYLSGELEAARAESGQALAANTALAEQFLAAQMAASEADAKTVALSARLEERTGLVEKLEHQLSQLAPLALMLDREIAHASCAGNQLQNTSPVDGVSLFCEITQATTSDSGAYAAAALDGAMAQRAGDLSSRASSSTAVCSAWGTEEPQAAGVLYWLTIYTHMLMSLYLRLWVRPILRLMSLIAHAALGFVVPNALLHINISLLLARLGIVASAPRPAFQ